METDRPEFRINPENRSINNPVNGKRMLYFPKSSRRCREVQSYVVVVFFIALVFCGIISIFLFKALSDPNQCVKEIVVDDDFDDRTGFVTGREYGAPTMRCADGGWDSLRVGPYYAGGVSVPEIPIGTIIAVILNSVAIIIFNAIWGRVSVFLNDWENHRTDTEYEDALILKSSAFRMVNSYAALAYIAFLKEPVINRLPFVDIYAMCPFVENNGNEGRSCLNELGLQLFSIFVVDMIVDTISKVGVPWILSRFKKGDDESDDDDHGEFDFVEDFAVRRMKSLVELEFDRLEYDALMGTFNDYAELLIQFGYATIFTAAFPMAPALAFVNNYYKIRLNIYKLCQLSRRAEPRSAEDIGTWELMFQAISVIAVISNCALIVFVGAYLKDYQKWLPFPALDPSPSDGVASRSVQGYRWLLFFVMEHAIFGAKLLLDLLIDDVPPDVQIQMSRQALVVSKLIDDINSDSEDSDEDVDSLDRLPNNEVWHTDDDVVLRQHEANEYRAKMAQACQIEMEDLGDDQGDAQIWPSAPPLEVGHG